MSRRAATSRTRWRGPSGVSTMPSGLEVEHGAVERHRHLVLRLEADGGLELLAGSRRRKLEDADDDPLVGDADAHALVQLVGPEELAQRLGEGLDVGDLAVADDAGLERDARRRARSSMRPLTLHRGRGDGARLDVEADDGR